MRRLAALLRLALLAGVLTWPHQAGRGAHARQPATSVRAGEAAPQPVARASSPVPLLAAPRGAGAAMHGATPGPAELAPALAPAIPARIVFACSAAVRAALATSARHFPRFPTGPPPLLPLG